MYTRWVPDQDTDTPYDENCTPEKHIQWNVVEAYLTHTTQDEESKRTQKREDEHNWDIYEKAWSMERTTRELA